MRLERVDLNLFIVFEAIYRERSVTNVSKLLNLTQPAVSNALSRLRQTFDDQLFVRTPSGMAPTPVADNVIADVRKALALLASSVGINAQFSPSISEKTFKLGINDLTEALLLPSLMNSVKKVAPNISLTSFYVDRKKATEDLKSGSLDLLIDAATYNVDEIRHKPLAKLQYVLAMRSGHPLNQTKISLNKYLSSEHIHVSSRREGKGQMDVVLQSLGYARNIKMRIQNYQVAARIVEQTDLLWTVPKILIGDTNLIFQELPYLIEPLAWNLYWHKSALEDPANIWMREMIEEIIRGLL